MKLQKYTINVISKLSDSSMGIAKVIATSEKEAITEVAKFYLERYAFEKSRGLPYFCSI